MYYLEEYEGKSPHAEYSENKERGDEEEKEMRVGKVETIRATSSISCIAVCAISSRLAIAKRSPPVISVYNIHCRKDSSISSVHLEAEHILDVLIELSSPIPLSMTSTFASSNVASIRKLAIYDSYLAYSTQFDVRIINLVFSQSKGKGLFLFLHLLIFLLANEEKETKQDVNSSLSVNQIRIHHVLIRSIL